MIITKHQLSGDLPLAKCWDPIAVQLVVTVPSGALIPSPENFLPTPFGSPFDRRVPPLFTFDFSHLVEKSRVSRPHICLLELMCLMHLSLAHP
jgi:hypothetical protein